MQVKRKCYFSPSPKSCMKFYSSPSMFCSTFPLLHLPSIQLEFVLYIEVVLNSEVIKYLLVTEQVKVVVLISEVSLYVGMPILGTVIFTPYAETINLKLVRCFSMLI